jgi:hypothetical protein
MRQDRRGGIDDWEGRYSKLMGGSYQACELFHLCPSFVPPTPRERIVEQSSRLKCIQLLA